MFGRVLSALFSFAGWLFKSSMVKWGLFFGLYFITTSFIPFLVEMLPGATELSSAFSQQSPGVWYFLDIFKIEMGVGICLSAAVTKFIIRRIPIIG